MVRFNPLEDKDFTERTGKYFDAGNHEVILQSLEVVTPENGSPYIKVSVLGTEDQEADVRLYISEKAVVYTVQKLARIAVHNTEGETKKTAIRESFKKIDDTDKLTDKFLSNMKNMDAWLNAYEDVNGQQKPNGGYYLRYDIDSFPREPKKTTADDLVSKFVAEGATPVDNDEIPFGDS